MKILIKASRVIASLLKVLLYKAVYTRRFRFKSLSGIFLGSGSAVDLQRGNGTIVAKGRLVVRRNAMIKSSGGEILFLGGCFINNGSSITCIEKVTIGDGVSIGENVLIYDHDHEISPTAGPLPNRVVSRPVVIGAGTWIGSGSIVLRGATIGKNCVIAAGSVVKGAVPDGSVFFNERKSQLRPLGQKIAADDKIHEFHD